jgi:hypothetical protein
MSQQQAKAFISELDKNEKLERELYSILDSKFSKPITSEEQTNRVLSQIVDFAKDHGFSFTSEEYEAALTKPEEAHQGEFVRRRVTAGSCGMVKQWRSHILLQVRLAFN